MAADQVAQEKHVLATQAAPTLAQAVTPPEKAVPEVAPKVTPLVATKPTGKVIAKVEAASVPPVRPEAQATPLAGVPSTVKPSAGPLSTVEKAPVLIPPVTPVGAKAQATPAVTPELPAPKAGSQAPISPVIKQREKAALQRKQSLEKLAQEVPHAVEPPKKTKRELAREKRQRQREGFIDFTFDNTDLTEAINRLAAAKRINIILPQGTQAITQKLTFKPSQELTIPEAERYLSTFLNLAGYSMHPQNKFYVVVKNDPNIVREPLPLFVNIPPDKLPYGDQRIRAIYYLSNLRVPDNATGSDPINTILKDMLSPAPTGNYMFDPRSNGIIITDMADTISSVMTILTELDMAGTRDMIEVVPLFNAVSGTVAKLLQTQILNIASGGGTRPEVRTATSDTSSTI